MTGEQYLSLTFHRRMIQAFSSAFVNVSFCAKALSFTATCGFGHLLKSVTATAPRDLGLALVKAGVVSDMGLLTLSPKLCLLIGDNASILTGASSKTAAVLHMASARGSSSTSTTSSVFIAFNGTTSVTAWDQWTPNYSKGCSFNRHCSWKKVILSKLLIHRNASFLLP